MSRCAFLSGPNLHFQLALYQSSRYRLNVNITPVIGRREVWLIFWDNRYFHKNDNTDWAVFQGNDNIDRTVFKIFQKAFKIENFPKIMVTVMLRKTLILGIAKNTIKTTFVKLKHSFKIHSTFLWAISPKYCSIVGPFIYYPKSTIWLFLQFTPNQAYRFPFFLYIPLAIQHSLTRWYFHSKSDSCKMQVFFPFRVFSMEILICSKRHIIPNFNLFPKTGVVITSIQLREDWLNSWFKMLTIVPKNNSIEEPQN